MKTNNTVGNVRKAGWALGAALLLCATSAHAEGRLELENAVFTEIEVKTEDGKTERRQVPAAKVLPGDEVVYVISYRNVGDGPVEDVAITNPVPPALIFVESEGPVPISAVSVDQGETYGALVELTVPGPDGDPRPAQPADVTHLRWILQELQPGTDGAVSFAARVR